MQRVLPDDGQRVRGHPRRRSARRLILQRHDQIAPRACFEDRLVHVVKERSANASRNVEQQQLLCRATRHDDGSDSVMLRLTPLCKPFLRQIAAQGRFSKQKHNALVALPVSACCGTLACAPLFGEVYFHEREGGKMGCAYGAGQPCRARPTSGKASGEHTRKQHGRHSRLAVTINHDNRGAYQEEQEEVDKKAHKRHGKKDATRAVAE